LRVEQGGSQPIHREIEMAAPVTEIRAQRDYGNGHC
jgi:hypothetical protein